MSETDNDMTNIIDLKEYFTKRYTPGDWINDEIADGASFEEILSWFDLEPGEVFEFLLNAGFINEDTLVELLEVQ